MIRSSIRREQETSVLWKVEVLDAVEVADVLMTDISYLMVVEH